MGQKLEVEDRIVYRRANEDHRFNGKEGVVVEIGHSDVKVLFDGEVISNWVFMENLHLTEEKEIPGDNDPDCV